MYSNENPVNVIIGAGLTGLTVGSILARNGEKCLLFEREDKVGGLAQSFTLKNCIFDLGPHVLYYDYPSPAVRFIKNLIKKGEYDLTDFKENFLMNGKYFGFPLEIMDFIRLPLNYFLSFLKAAISKKLTDRSFKSNIQSRMGTQIYHGFFAPYINKKTGCSNGGQNLHEDWWLRAKRNYKNEVVRAKNTRRSKGEHRKDLVEKLYYMINILLKALRPKDNIFYPRKGIEVIPNKLWEVYQKYGGQTIFNVDDIKILFSNDRINKVVVDSKQYNVKNLVWTGRVPELCDLLSLECKDMQYVSCGLMFVVLNGKKKRTKKRVLCHYFPDPDIIFNRIYYPSYFCEETVPEGKDAFCVEITLENEMKRWTPEMLIKATKTDLQKLGICDIEEIETIEYKKLSQVYPIYTLDYEVKLKKVFGKLRKFRNLFPIGRLGGFYFCMMYDAINQGIETAEHILYQKGKTWH